MVGDHLKQISESDNQLLSLHQALVRKLKKPSKGDTSISERQTWFSNFISHEGKRLPDKEVKDLASITKHWALGNIRCLEYCAELWAKWPYLFCDGERPDEDVIRRCYSDLERMREIDPTRRKVLLVTLSRQVRQKQEQILSDPKARKRCRKQQIGHSTRSSTRLTSALGEGVSQVWDDPEERQDERRKTLSRYSLWGWKWERLTHRELILSLTHATATRLLIETRSSTFIN